MGNLYRKLRPHFRFIRGDDCMPILASPNAGREKGRHMIAKAMADMGFVRGAEIGTRYGASAKIWCEAMPELRLTCIDPWRAYHRISQAKQDAIYEAAGANLAPYNVEMLRMTSMEAVDGIADESLDFVNIDGDHTFDACAMDLIRWVPKVRKGGLVLVHDYCTFRLGGVIKAVDAYTHCHRIESWYVTRDYEPTAFWERGTEQA